MNLFELTASIAVNANPYVAAINTATKVTTQLVGGIEELTVESVLLASKFERSANSIAVFSGSLSSAKRELYEIDKISRNTVGLRMEAAEEGYQRLRALGFEAKRANSLIKELGEEKELSGADDEALKRTFFNFTQIASGGQKISQEIRELLTAMPSLKRAFLDAFGTLDPKKIQSIVESNPDAFFDRLTSAMEKNKAAAGGLDNATGKLEDAWTEAKRAFGEPLLPELTKDVKSLTNYIQSNKKTWGDWGEYVRDVITGVRKTASDFAAHESKNYNPQESAIETGKLAGLKYLSVFGLIRKEFDYYEQKGKEVNQKNNTQDRTNQFESAWSDLEGEQRADNVIQEEKRIRDEEIARQKEITNLITWKNAKDSIFDSSYSQQEAKLTSYLTNGYKEEAKQVNDLANLRADRYKNELSRTNSYYNRMIVLANGDKVEIQKIEADKAQDVAKINADFVKDTYSTQRKLAEIERDSYNDRLKESINFKRQLTDEFTFQLDTDSFNFGEKLKESFAPQSETFDQMIRLTKESYAEVLRVTRESYDEQLKEIGISEDRKINIRREAAFAEKKLAEQTRRDVLRIEEDKKNKIGQFYADIFGAVASAEQQKIQRKTTFLDSVFGGSNLNSSELKKVSELVAAKGEEYKKLKDAYRSADNARLDAENAELKFQGELNKRQDLFRRGKITDISIGTIQPEDKAKMRELKNAVDDAKEKSNQAYSALSQLEGGMSDFYEDYGSFNKLLISNLGDETIFDQISEKMLQMEKNSAFSVLDAKINQARLLLETPAGKTDVKAQANLESLLNERGNLTAEYFQKEQEQRANSITGLREYIGLLQNNDPVLTAIVENKKLTESLHDQADAYEKLIGSTKLNKEELNARVLQTLANQPTLTDIIGDTEVGAINDTFDAIDSGFDSITEALGIADTALGNFFENFFGGLAKLAANEIFKMIFNVDGNASQTLNGESSGGGGFWRGLLNFGIKVAGQLLGASFGGGGGGHSLGGGGINMDAAAGLHAATGGLITGGIKNKDSVAAWLMPDEFVARKAAVDYYGAGFFSALNEKKIPKEFFGANHFADGGLASGIDTVPISFPQANDYSSVSHSSNDRNITLNITQNISGGGSSTNTPTTRASHAQAARAAFSMMLEAERRK